MALERLVKGVADMPVVNKRKISAIIGALVADAASLPLEWIYKDDDMQRIVGSENPEFWPKSHCPFYTLPTGSLSCYGDELKTSLSTLAESDSKLDTELMEKSIEKIFGSPDSPYQIALAKRALKVYPIEGPWINGGVIKSLENMNNGVKPPGSATCEDNDGFAIALPAFLIGLDPEIGHKYGELLTTYKIATDHMKIQQALIKCYVNDENDPLGIVKREFSTELPDIIDEMKAVDFLVREGKSVGEIVSTCGKACGLPGSFQGALAVLQIEGNDFVSAIRKNILAGGDCNARGLQVGAYLGAKLGIENIPMDWIQKVTGSEKILEEAVKVFA